MATKGHNVLTSLVERIERLEGEKADLADDIRLVYAEGKANGINTKILREVIRLRKLDRDTLAERAALLAEYGSALGMDLL
jgi:uncharacterized protein (UPF0335 family)